MSGTPHIKSLSIATETTFGSISATTGQPDAASVGLLTYVSLECERAPIMVAGEAPIDERPDTRAGFYIHAPEVDTACDINGAPIPRRTGQIQIDQVVTMIGTAGTFANYAAHPIGQMLGAVLRYTAPGALTDVIAAGLSDTKFTAGAAGNFVDGGMICQAQGGVGNYAFVSKVDVADITFSPAMTSTPSGTMRLGSTYSTATQFTELGASLSFRGDGDGFRWYAVGCRPSALNITTTPHMVKFSWTIECAHIFDDNFDASVTAGTNIVDPVIADGCAAHMLQTVSAVSTLNVVGLTSPAELAKTDLIVDEFSASLAWTLGARGTAATPIGIADYEVTDFVCDVDILASIENGALTQESFLKRELHSLIVGLSNVSEGNGLCLYLPAAALQADPDVRDLGGDIIKYRYLLKQSGPWTGDTASGSASPGGKPFRIGLGN